METEERQRRRVGRPSKAERIKSLEQKFNLAESLVQELDEIIEDVPDEIEEPQLPELIETSIMCISSLKQDFMLARNNIIKLINTGQRILDQASVLEISDLKASQLEALAVMQSTLGANLKLLLEIYKDIAAIEKSRSTLPPPPTAINNGQVTTNNIMFTGSSSDLLKLINDNAPVKVN